MRPVMPVFLGGGNGVCYLSEADYSVSLRAGRLSR